jgi:clan AA aspartic protease
MITGRVSALHALVAFTVRGPNGREGNAEFVLDTGFTGYVTLPPARCAALGLVYLRPQPANLADRSPVILDVYAAALLWNGTERDVEVLAMEGPALLGMLALNGSDVRLQVAEGGLVTIEPL